MCHAAWGGEGRILYCVCVEETSNNFFRSATLKQLTEEEKKSKIMLDEKIDAEH